MNDWLTHCHFLGTLLALAGVVIHWLRSAKHQELEDLKGSVDYLAGDLRKKLASHAEAVAEGFNRVNTRMNAHESLIGDATKRLDEQERLKIVPTPPRKYGRPRHDLRDK